MKEENDQKVKKVERQGGERTVKEGRKIRKKNR